jgi:hypothetical protein
VTGNETETQGNFLNYLAWADRHPEAKDGTDEECYERESGFCLERVAWIGHMLANLQLMKARQKTGNQKLVHLYDAFVFERRILGVWQTGFGSDITIKSSCDVLREISVELKALNRSVDSSDPGAREAWRSLQGRLERRH